jgi:hypothetical protein
MMGREIHEFTPTELLEWSRAGTPLMPVRTATDALPGGLSMAMAPLLVNWRESSIGAGSEHYLLVHNLNIASNPIAGVTILATARIPAASIESVEFVFVASKVGRRATNAGHGMLRFIFKEGRGPAILDRTGQPLVHNATIPDLVLSWEAWRPPTAGFDPIEGLDPEKYALTMRGFSGATRCLSDAILDRPWVCYPIRFPDVADADDDFKDELLYVSLLLGDALARQTIGDLLDHHIEETGNVPEDYAEHGGEDWKELRALLEDQRLPENPIGDILDGKVRYHLLERSCITMALMTLDWANLRIHHRANLPEPKRVRVTPKSLPGAIDMLGEKRRRSALLRMPAAIHWLMNNQTVIPGKSYQLLDEVGLLQREKDKIVQTTFDNRDQSAYGPTKGNLIY